jgi:hypothetical protein
VKIIIRQKTHYRKLLSQWTVFRDDVVIGEVNLSKNILVFRVWGKRATFKVADLEQIIGFMRDQKIQCGKPLPQWKILGDGAPIGELNAAKDALVFRVRGSRITFKLAELEQVVGFMRDWKQEGE